MTWQEIEAKGPFEPIETTYVIARSIRRVVVYAGRRAFALDLPPIPLGDLLAPVDKPTPQRSSE
jgi:hypothetical protein